MTQNKLLTREIVRHILTSFGVSSTSVTDNSLIGHDLLTSKKVRIKYDDEAEIDHLVFAGQLSIGKDAKFKAIAIDLTTESESPEFCCVFRLENLPLHGLKLCYDDEDTGLFKIHDDTGKAWADAPIVVQAMILGGVEQVVSYGLLWEPLTDFADLYKAAVILAGA
jgi:hypothetical protein